MAFNGPLAVVDVLPARCSVESQIREGVDEFFARFRAVFEDGAAKPWTPWVAVDGKTPVPLNWDELVRE